MNHEQVVKAGNELTDVLTVQARLLSSHDALPQQVELIKSASDVNMKRLNRLSDLVDADCMNCNHSKARHEHGRGKCDWTRPEMPGSELFRCHCNEWQVEP